MAPSGAGIKPGIGGAGGVGYFIFIFIGGGGIGIFIGGGGGHGGGFGGSGAFTSGALAAEKYQLEFLDFKKKKISISQGGNTADEN